MFLFALAQQIGSSELLLKGNWKSLESFSWCSLSAYNTTSLYDVLCRDKEGWQLWWQPESDMASGSARFGFRGFLFLCTLLAFSVSASTIGLFLGGVNDANMRRYASFCAVPPKLFEFMMIYSHCWDEMPGLASKADQPRQTWPRKIQYAFNFSDMNRPTWLKNGSNIMPNNAPD